MGSSIKEQAHLLVLVMKFIDITLIIGSGILCFFSLEPIKHFPSYQGLFPQNYLTIIILGSIFSAWWFPAFNVYNSWRGNHIFGEIKALFIGWCCSLLGLLVFVFLTKTATNFSRHWFILWFFISLLVLMLSRFMIRAILHILREKGYNLRHIVLVGSGELSEQVSKKIQKSSWMGLKINGLFTDTPETYQGTLNILGHQQELFDYLERFSIDQVWITLPLKDMAQIDALCRGLHSIVVNVKLVPDISSLRLLNYSTTQLDGMPIINMSISPMSSSNRLIKWLEDKILSLSILIVISPVLCLIALSVKLSSTGPIFYKQERVGSNGKKFQMLKFRSMPIHNEETPVWGEASHKQKTKMGDFLRKTSLDELPQFINVLKGDMSIVGPRPERTLFVEQFKHEINSYMQKHLVQAGITGWAQINGWRGDTCLKTRLEYDLFYIENWSLWFDLKIILLTFYKGFLHSDN